MTDLEDISVGETLSTARKRKRLRYKKLSNELNIDETYLVALEEENYQFIPGGDAYVKGFLRSYAKKLDLSPDKIVARYVASQASISTNLSTKKVNQKRNNIRFYIVSFFVSLFLLILYYSFSSLVVESPLKEGKVNDKSTTVQSVEQTNEQSMENLDLEDSIDALTSSEGSKFEFDLEVSEPMQLGVVVDESAEESLTLITLYNDCWLEVFTENERLLYKLARAGEQFVYKEEKLKIIVGNFKNIEISFNDKIVNLGNYANKNQVSCIVLPDGDCSEFREPNN